MMRKSTATIAILLASLASTAQATPGNSSYTTMVSSTVYVERVMLNTHVDTDSELSGGVYYFSFRVVDAAGAGVDACSDITGVQALVYLTPTAGTNLELAKMLIQSAFLGRLPIISLKTEKYTVNPNTINATDVCIVKQITVGR